VFMQKATIDEHSAAEPNQVHSSSKPQRWAERRAREPSLHSSRLWALAVHLPPGGEAARLFSTTPSLGISSSGTT